MRADPPTAIVAEFSDPPLAINALKAPTRDHGFTLIEVLVALIIFGIAFGVIAAIFQTSLLQAAKAEILMDATAIAEQQIGRFGHEVSLAVGQSAGLADEGLAWQTKVTLAAPLQEGSDIALYRISVDVSSSEGERHYLTLQTLRIGPAP